MKRLLNIFVSVCFISGTMSVWANENPDMILMTQENKPSVLENSINEASDSISQDRAVAPVKPTVSTAPVVKTVTEATEPETTVSESAKSENIVSESKKPETTVSLEPKTEVSKPETAVSETAMASSDDLNVVEFVLTDQIQSREPKERVETFTQENERGFAFARLEVKTPGEITFVWTRNGTEYSRMKMPVQAAKKWRTYSSVKLRPGDWKVELIDGNQKVLAEKTFKVE